jgi:hypothetical protein
VVRTKETVLLQRRYWHPVDKSTGARSDQTGVLKTIGSATAYPEALRRVSYFGDATGIGLVFLTNKITLPVLTIAISPSRFDSQAIFVMFVTSVGSIPQKSHNHIVVCDHNQDTPSRH